MPSALSQERLCQTPVRDAAGPTRPHPWSAQSLQARIAAAILTTAIAVLAVGCTLFMLEQHRAERVMQRQAGEQLAEVVAEASSEDLSRGDAAEATRDLQVLRAFDQVVWAELAMPDGRRVTYRRASAPAGTGGLKLVRSPLSWRGRRAGGVTLALAPPPAGRTFSRYLAAGGALFFAATALALFLGRWLAARITTPVARLARAMDTVGKSGAFQVRVEPGAPDEIGRLTARFNELMARLEIKDAALRRTLDELVEARDAAEAANVAKSQFLANMSHEIRTPLNGVLAMAQVLARSPLEAGQHAQVEVIRRSGEALLSLLNDILDVSKIEAGKLQTEAAEFDAGELVTAAAAAFAAVAERKALALSVEVAPDACGWRLGDAARLRQILNNFISNALKFTEAGGVRIVMTGAADHVRIAVSDSGIGMAADKLPLLFQTFTQLDASTTRRFGGSGLGLAISRELAELMGGSVWVESQPGVGSTFGVSLPLPRAPAPAAAAPAAEAGETQDETEDGGQDEAAPPPLRVLAAEDNPTNQLVLTTIMPMFGVSLTMTDDGAEALEAWRAGEFDLVLMDIQMPRMDGVAATRAIRAEEAASGRARTPILALSANALTHQVEQYLAAGMDGHVAKPIELATLQAALEAVFAAAEPQAAGGAESAAAAAA